MSAGRAHALSRRGLRWWHDAYCWSSESDIGNRRAPQLLSTAANELRIRALVREMNAGISPKICGLLVVSIGFLALARARDYIAGETEIAGGSSPATEPSSMVADADFIDGWFPESGSTADALGEFSDSTGVSRLNSASLPAGKFSNSERSLERRTERHLDDVPESEPMQRDGNRNPDRLISAALLNRPVDSGSPHWWQNIRQDGTSGFAGTATSSQSLFSNKEWSDWHGGAGARPAYSHVTGQGVTSMGEPNLSFGPLEADLAGFISSEYTDNRNLTHDDKSSGVVLAAGLNATGLIDITDTRRLQFNIGVGVDQYIGDGDDADRDGLQLHVTPDTYLDFAFGVGDLEFRLYDRFTLRRNRRLTSFQPDAVDTSDYWANTIGLSALYPLNDALSAHVQVDQTRQASLQDGFNQIDNDTVTGSAGLTLSPNGEYTIGAQGTVSRRDYDSAFNNDSDVLSFGAFAHRSISEFTRLEASAGYQTFDFETDGASGDREQLSDYYASGAIRNELNEAMTHALIGGHGADYGASSNFESYDFVRYEMDARISAATAVGVAVGHRWNDESGSRDAQDETLNLSVHGSHQVSDHVTIGLRGAYTRNEANISGRDFEETRLQSYARVHLNESATVNFSYQRWEVSGHADGYVENSLLTGLSIDF